MMTNSDLPTAWDKRRTDRDVLVMAARDAALDLTTHWRKTSSRTTDEIIARAIAFEEFLLANPAAGLKALETVHSDSLMATAELPTILAAATSYARWLSCEVASAELKPKLMRDDA